MIERNGNKECTAIHTPNQFKQIKTLDKCVHRKVYDCRFVHVDCFTACNRAVAAAAAAAAAKQSKEIFYVFIHTHNY